MEKDIFSSAIETLDRGDSLDSLKEQFSVAEIEEVKALFSILEKGRQDMTMPHKESFRKMLQNLPDLSVSPRKEKAHSTLVSNKGKVWSFEKLNWRITLPATAFAALVFAFLANGFNSQKISQEMATAPDVVTTPEGEISAVTSSSENKTKTFSKPLPQETGKADDLVAAMFSDMDEESSSANADMSQSNFKAQEDSNDLSPFSYEAI